MSVASIQVSESVNTDGSSWGCQSLVPCTPGALAGAFRGCRTVWLSSGQWSTDGTDMCCFQAWPRTLPWASLCALLPVQSVHT